MPVLQKHSKFERMRGCNCSFIIKKVPIIELALKKGMTASACFKETQYP